MAHEIICRTRDQWMDYRRGGVTASEISAILGISPWLSAFSLYWHKVLGYEEGDNALKARGRRLEALVSEDFQDAHRDLRMAHPSRGLGYAILYANENRPWQLCTPDALAWPFTDYPARTYDAHPQSERPDPNPTVQPVELKTSATRRGWGPSGSDIMPSHYRAQLLWQIDTFDAEQGWLAVWIGLDDYREYCVRRDEEDLVVMRAAAERFMDQVKNEQPPSVDGLASTTATLRHLHPTLTDEIVEVPDDLAAQWDRVRHEISAAKIECRQLENDLRAKMGSAVRAVDSQGDTVATRIVYDRRPYQVQASTIDRLWGRSG